MVSKEIIIKTLDNIIQEKHGAYFTRIRHTLKQVTDTKEEYETLRDDIFKFYLETRHRKTERLIMKTTDGKFFDTSDNDADSVYYTDEMKDATDILYTGHNHPLPNGDSCVQSSNDLYSQVLQLSKYAWTIGKDGLMITKLDYGGNSPSESEVIMEHNKLIKKHYDTFLKEYDKQLQPLKEKYPNWDNPTRLDSDYFQQDAVPYLQSYLCKHSQEFINELKNNYKKRHIGVKCYYAKSGR